MQVETKYLYMLERVLVQDWELELVGNFQSISQRVCLLGSTIVWEDYRQPSWKELRRCRNRLQLFRHSWNFHPNQN